MDDELKKQLARAEVNSRIGATFTLRGKGRVDLTPAETNAIVARLLQETEASTRAKAADVSIFANVQSFAVEGPAVLIRKLAERAEVESATANVHSEELLIRPVARKKVRLPTHRKQ